MPSDFRPGDQYESLGPRCPYCGYTQVADEKFYYELDGDFDCPKCDKTYAVIAETTTTWSSSPKD